MDFLSREKNHRTTIFLVLLFLGGCLTLITLRQQGFLSIDQRGLFFAYGQNAQTTAFGHTIEYPIGAWYFFRACTILATWTAIFFENPFQGFAFFFSLSITLAYAAVWALCVHWTTPRRPQEELAVGIAFLVFFFAANPYLVLSTFDTLPILCLLGSTLLLLKRHDTWSAVLLGVAISLKWFPGVFLPLALLFLFQNTRRLPWKYALSVTLTALALVLAGRHWLPLPLQFASIHYQGERGIHIESVYGNILMIAERIRPSLHIATEYRWQAFHLNGRVPTLVAPITTIVLLGSLLFVYASAWKKKQKDEQWLLRYTLLATMAFFLFNKVFSGQFVFWGFPLLLLYIWKEKPAIRWAILGAYTVAVALYPLLITWQVAFVHFATLPLLVLTLRNILLAVVFLFVFLDFFPANKNRVPLARCAQDPSH
jgi:hypothetical protein